MTTYSRNRTKRQERTYQRGNNVRIPENEPVPFEIMDCKEGTTEGGKETWTFLLRHLDTNQEVRSTVFLGQAPDYIEETITDAMLPEDVKNYDLSDFIGKGLFVVFKFNEKNGKVYMNIIDAFSLDEAYEELLDAKRSKKCHKQSKMLKAHAEVEEEMSEGSSRPLRGRPKTEEDDEFYFIDDSDLIDLDSDELHGDDEELNLDEY